MIRIAALNDADQKSTDGGDRIKAPSQQVEEAEILKRYNEALTKQKQGHLKDALEIYKELLSTPYLAKAEPVENSQKVLPNGLSPIFGKTDLNLKYSCYKNLAEINRKQKLLSVALDYYNEALALDGTDVTMWYNAGIVGSKLGLIYFAPHAFLRGVACSNQNVPCLDRAAISLFIVGDFTLSMEVLGYLFKLKPDYSRGLLLRDIMLESQPWLKIDMNLFCPGINLQFDKIYDGPQDIRSKLMKEIETLRSNYQLQKKREDEKAIPDLELIKPLQSLKWELLGEGLLLLSQRLIDNNESASLRRIDFLTSLHSFKKEALPKGKKEGQDEPMDVAEDNLSLDSLKETNTQSFTGDDRKGKRKSGSSLMEELLWSGKRRSARVRSSRKEQESICVADALTSILPRKLLHKIKAPLRSEAKSLDEDLMDTMDLYRLFGKEDGVDEQITREQIAKSEGEQDREKVVANEGYFDTLQEENDVRHFLESHDKFSFVDAFKCFVLALDKLWVKTWSKKLMTIFMDCYKTMRHYFPIQLQFLSCEQLRNAAFEESGAMLLYHELMVDTSECGELALPLADMQNLMELSGVTSVFPDPLSQAMFELRLMWMRAHLFLCRGNSSEAIWHLHSALDCYTKYPELDGKSVKLSNCRRNNLITKDIVQGCLDAQSRKKSLAEVVRLYEEGSYKEVTEVLTEYFDVPSYNAGFSRDQENEVVDHKTQLTMLINALYQLDEYKCVYWLETSCYELVTKTSRPTSNVSELGNEEWKIEFDRALCAIEECCDLGEFIITDALPLARLARFVQTLCHAICKQIEDVERPPCASRPWILLNRILVSLEEAESSSQAKGEDDDEEPDIPSSVLVLFTAHEYLGRREWCNCDGNVLLFLIMDQVIPRFRLPEWASFRDTVQQYLDQVVFCLYAHPSKKTKTRNITEHNVTPIPLTWNRAMQLYQLYRPDEMPCFDSLRANIISADTEVLLRRIAALIPDDIDPAQTAEAMNDFIYGRLPAPPQTRVKLPEQVQDLFYILGDYYYKTHECAKAVNYLLIDLCANRDRVDGWASMALSKVFVLELQLNSCEPIKNEEFLKDAMAAVHCYQHCLSLDNSLCTLWIEYGSFAYTVHSFCSQRMKLESDSLSLEQFEEMETTKTKMLEKAKEAFINANNIWNKGEEEDKQDERWLHHYMLGKISEKNGDFAYLEHYEKASQLLHENNATYPKKISYNAPQTLSIEAMEIYYRAHVCVIKCLELHDGEPLNKKTRAEFTNFLHFFAQCPFVKQASKGDVLKQKAKEADEVEAAKQKETDLLMATMNDIISAIEKEESNSKAERQETVNMMRDLVEDILLACHPSIEMIHCSQEMENTIDECDVKMCVKAEEEAEDKKGKIVSEEIGKKRTIIQGSPPEIINLSSDEDATYNDILYSKDELDQDMLKLAEIAAEQENQDPSAAVAEISSASVGGACTQSSENPSSDLPITYPPDEPFQPYPHEQLLDDNYYLTLEDLHKKKKTRTGKRKQPSKRASSASSDSEDVVYADESSSSSSSTISNSSTSGVSGNKEMSAEAKKREKQHKKDAREVKGNGAEELRSEENFKVEPGAVTGAAVEDSEPLQAEIDPEAALLEQCLSAFETCALRFPQHYKSVYRLAHFFYRSKKHRDLNKCRELLLGQYATSNGNIGGLFAEKKNTNFFNGIWRLPAGDVDRPGSFASHMSRSVLLLLEVLRDLRDHKLLLELCLLLRKVPDPDKRYLREDERNQLSKQALTLSLQTLRHTTRYSEVMTLPIVLDAYRVYRKVQKHYPTKENVFAECLLDAFNRLGKGKCPLDQCLKFCQAELTGNRMAFPPQTSMTAQKTKKAKKYAREVPLRTKLAKPTVIKEVAAAVTTIPDFNITESNSINLIVGNDATSANLTVNAEKSTVIKEVTSSGKAVVAVKEAEIKTATNSQKATVSETKSDSLKKDALRASNTTSPYVYEKEKVPSKNDHQSGSSEEKRSIATPKAIDNTSKDFKKTVPGSTLPSVDLAPSLAGLMKQFPNVSGTGPLPDLSALMFPQQPYFGFPVDYTNESFVNHYSYMANYLARFQGQNTLDKAPKPRKLRPVNQAPANHTPPQAHAGTQATRLVPPSYTNPPSSHTPTLPQPALTSSMHLSISKVPQSVKPTVISKLHNKPIASQQLSPKPYKNPKTLLSDTKEAPKLQTEAKVKFNIDDILSKNSSITVTQNKRPPVSSVQAQAMNLCAKSKEGGKRSSGEQSGGAVKKPCLEPELVTIDD